MDKKIKSIIAYDRKDFRSWLKKNHKKETKVKIILYKKHTGKKSPSHRELMEEAICFGWIDTTIKKLDEDRYVRNFSKRNKNSKWSDNTLSYARDLIGRGLMQSEGLKYYELGKNKPSLDHGIPKNPDMPEELKKSLEKNNLLKEFENKSNSKKRMLYRWILFGKQEQTRDKRIKKIIESIKEGKEVF